MHLRQLFKRRERITSPAVREEMIDMAENMRREGQEAEAIQVERLLGVYTPPRPQRL